MTKCDSRSVPGKPSRPRLPLTTMSPLSGFIDSWKSAFHVPCVREYFAQQMGVCTNGESYSEEGGQKSAT